MRQLTLFADEQHNQIVNVASVPQRSPFRYPGGKTWLVPRIRQWLASLPARPAAFIEPFAGGGSVGLAVAFERLTEHVTLVELDAQVAAVWETMLNGEGQWLAQQMSAFDLTLDSVKTLLSRTDLSRTGSIAGASWLQALDCSKRARTGKGCFHDGIPIR